MSTPGAEKTERLVALLEELLQELNGSTVEVGAESARLRDEVARRDAEILARHQELVAVDHVIGLEATNSRLLKDLRRARARVKELTAELEAVRASRTWKVGRAFTRPLGKLRR